jgi:CheY-like chemotaxis protein
MPSLLIIDDEPAIATLIKRAGEACGYRVAAVSDPELFKRQVKDAPPEVICLDLAMPGTDGIELLRYLESCNCRAQLLVISGYHGAMVGAAVRLAEALGLAVAGVFHKPIRIAELKDLLTALAQSGRPAAA